MQLTGRRNEVIVGVQSQYVEACLFGIAQTDVRLVDETIRVFDIRVEIVTIISVQITTIIEQVVDVSCPGAPTMCSGRGNCSMGRCVCDSGCQSVIKRSALLVQLRGDCLSENAWHFQSISQSIVRVPSPPGGSWISSPKICMMHLLRDLHWLRVPERIQFRLAVLAFCCRNHKVPSYLADELHWTDDVESWHQLRSGSCPRLIVPRTRHHRRLIISCDCRMCMEQSSYQHHSINLFAIFQETT